MGRHGRRKTLGSAFALPACEHARGCVRIGGGHRGLRAPLMASPAGSQSVSSGGPVGFIFRSTGTRDVIRRGLCFRPRTNHSLRGFGTRHTPPQCASRRKASPEPPTPILMPFRVLLVRLGRGPPRPADSISHEPTSWKPSIQGC